MSSICFLNRRRETCTEVAKSAFSIAPEITMLCKVQKHTVPLHMFVPVKLRLYLFYHIPAGTLVMCMKYFFSNTQAID